MNKNVKIAKELVKLAKNLVALDEEGDGSGFQPIIANKQEELDRAEKEGKKYILYRNENGRWRIMSCKDFGNVKKGYLGGLIESEDNLSQDGNCWVDTRAVVTGNAKVYGNATIQGGIGGFCYIEDNSEIYGNAVISCNYCEITGNAKIYDAAKILGEKVYISENAKVYGNAKVSHGDIKGDAKIYGKANILGGRIDGSAEVYGNSSINGYAHINMEMPKYMAKHKYGDWLIFLATPKSLAMLKLLAKQK